MITMLPSLSAFYLREHHAEILSKIKKEKRKKRNSHLLQSTSNCSLTRSENGKWDPEGKDAKSQCIFQLQSIFTKVFQFSGKQFLNSKKTKTKTKTVLSLPFTVLKGVGTCMLKKEEVQLPLKFLQESTAYPLRPNGTKALLSSASWIF